MTIADYIFNSLPYINSVYVKDTKFHDYLK